MSCYQQTIKRDNQAPSSPLTFQFSTCHNISLEERIVELFLPQHSINRLQQPGGIYLKTDQPCPCNTWTSIKSCCIGTIILTVMLLQLSHGLKLLLSGASFIEKRIKPVFRWWRFILYNSERCALKRNYSIPRHQPTLLLNYYSHSPGTQIIHMIEHRS